MSAQCLLLNSTYEPLGVVSLQRAVRLLFSKKAEIIHAVPDRELRAETIAVPLPSIIRLMYYIAHRRKSVPLTKKNVLLRDNYRCAYCSGSGGSEMTVDHVTPKSRGGSSSWANLVACCVRCNQRKRDRTPEEAGMPLRRKPHVPRYIPFVVIRRHTAPAEWVKYLTLYNVSIEERIE